MKIEDLAGQDIKICKSSITVKDEYGKTKGVVTNIHKFKDLRPNIQIDYFKQLKECGIWGSNFDGMVDCVVFDGKDAYYLNNMQPITNYETYWADADMPNEKARYEKRKEIAKAATKYFTVIDCKSIHV